jgi:hypothetical protein
MKTLVRCFLAVALLMVAAAARPAVAQTPNQVIHVWQCEMVEGTTETQVEGIAADWLKALRQMPGGANIKVQVIWPVAVDATEDVDFQFMIISPSFTDWGKLWDAYKDDSPAAKSDDLNQGKVVCPDSAIWELVTIDAK